MAKMLTIMVMTTIVKSIMKTLLMVAMTRV